MLKSLYVLVLCAVSQCPAFGQSVMYVGAINGVSFRKTASTGGEKITTIAKGEKIMVLANDASCVPFEYEGTHGSWRKAEYNKVQGYLYDGFLSDIPVPKKANADLVETIGSFQEVVLQVAKDKQYLTEAQLQEDLTVSGVCGVEYYLYNYGVIPRMIVETGDFRSGYELVFSGFQNAEKIFVWLRSLELNNFGVATFDLARAQKLAKSGVNEYVEEEASYGYKFDFAKDGVLRAVYAYCTNDMCSSGFSIYRSSAYEYTVKLIN